MLKLKAEFDTECEIVGYKKGTGKYEGMLGSFKCRLLKGNTKDTFFVSGMDDTIRKHYLNSPKPCYYYPIGTIITIVYNDMTDKGVPRHPRFLRRRIDHDL